VFLISNKVKSVMDLNEEINFSASEPENRRRFLKSLTSGVIGTSFGLAGFSGCAPSSRFTPNNIAPLKPSAIAGESRIALITGNDRRQMIFDSLKPFENQIKESIKNKQIVIKINCVQDSNPLIATHPDSVRGLLDFLKPIYGRQIIIGESTASEKGTRVTFEQYGYIPLEKEYNVKLIELNEESTTYQWILDSKMYPAQIRVINTFLDPDNYIFSITRLKTHNVAVATLTLKNVVMGSPLKIPKLKINDKSKMHANDKFNTSPKGLNFNLFLMAQRVRPDFCILDGVEGVEGNGPGEGEPVDHQLVLAGPDFVSVDRIGSELMGIPWEDIGYLQFCADAGLGQGERSKIKIIGPDPKNLVIKYKLHENIAWQLTWKENLIIPRKAKE
jgi:uncharacterized protein (DUF362 family)